MRMETLPVTTAALCSHPPQQHVSLSTPPPTSIQVRLESCSIALPLPASPVPRRTLGFALTRPCVCTYTDRQTHRHTCSPDCTEDVRTFLPVHTDTQTHESAGAQGYSCEMCTNVGVHVCDHIRVCVGVTVGADLAPSGYDETLGCGHI